jgi:hypothetical protein
MTDALAQQGEPIIVAEGPVARLKEIQRTLTSNGLSSQIVQPPDCNANA